MKHIKLFEDNEQLYEIGDYVLIIDELTKSWTHRPSPYAKIININTRDKYYRVKLYSMHDEVMYFWIRYDWVLRKLTQQEIDEFELKEVANKYNL